MILSCVFETDLLAGIVSFESFIEDIDEDE